MKRVISSIMAFCLFLGVALSINVSAESIIADESKISAQNNKCMSQVNDFQPRAFCHHVYRSQITTQPTCVKVGVRTYTCIKCGHVVATVISKVAHRYNWVVTKKPTYFEKGEKCFRCQCCAKISKREPVKKLRLSRPRVSLSSRDTKVFVKFNNVKNAEKYRISVTCGDWKKKYTTTNTLYILRNLDANKQYTVRVRAILSDGDKIARSRYSASKSIVL